MNSSIGKIRQFIQQEKIVIILFALFCFMSLIWLHRLPGLMGDEGSEGENVYQLLTADHITVIGERSYIGPLIDYVRILFILVFGYTALALRLLIFLCSAITFWLAWVVLQRLFGRNPALYGMVFLFFSPIYLLQERIGWAISLFPFFLFLNLFFLTGSYRRKWLWIGLVSGIGLANHLLFFPTLAALGVSALPAIVWRIFTNRSQLAWKKIGVSILEIIVGFWAGFGSQFVVLQFQTEDQGDPSQVVTLMGERIHDFTQAWPLYISASSYIARYTGDELSTNIQLVIVGILAISSLLAFLFLRKKLAIWLYVVFLATHLYVLFYMIDRFTLRYFIIFSIAIWLLAGLGLGAVLQKIPRKLSEGGALIIALVLSSWIFFGTYLPFLKTGGSLDDFSLGNRTNSAADLVDVRPLIDCLRGSGPVMSENVHIWNRLQYQSHQYSDLVVVPEEEQKRAVWSVSLREDDTSHKPQKALCPELTHFTVTEVR